MNSSNSHSSNISEIILSQLNWRYAVKKFDSQKKISNENWNILSESLRLAPSSYGLQPWKFILVQNKEIRAKLKAASWNQTQVEDCSHYVVFTTKKTMDETYIKKYVDSMVKVRNVELSQLAGYQSMMVDSLVKSKRPDLSFWAQKQSYIAMGFLLETAALLNIDSCPLEGIDPLTYDKILNLEDSEYQAVVAVALGYRHPEDVTQKNLKVRFDKNEILQVIL